MSLMSMGEFITIVKESNYQLSEIFVITSYSIHYTKLYEFNRCVANECLNVCGLFLPIVVILLK